MALTATPADFEPAARARGRAFVSARRGTLLDLKILLTTPLALFKTENAY